MIFGYVTDLKPRDTLDVHHCSIIKHVVSQTQGNYAVPQKLTVEDLEGTVLILYHGINIIILYVYVVCMLSVMSYLVFIDIDYVIEIHDTVHKTTHYIFCPIKRERLNWWRYELVQCIR